MSKQPYIPLYTGDYMQDTRALPLNVRGAWVELMIHMWRSEDRGIIVGTIPEFAMMMGCSFEEANSAIGLLQQKKICDYKILANGMLELKCRRMYREAETTRAKSKAGKASAEAKRVKASVQTHAETKQPTESQHIYDNDIDNDVANGIELKLKESLDEIYIDGQRPKWSHVDFDVELMGFQEKVRGSPGKYVDHDVGAMRLAFQSQLRSAKRKPESKNKQSKKNLTFEELKSGGDGNG